MEKPEQAVASAAVRILGRPGQAGDQAAGALQAAGQRGGVAAGWSYRFRIRDSKNTS